MFTFISNTGKAKKDGEYGNSEEINVLGKLGHLATFKTLLNYNCGEYCIDYNAFPALQKDLNCGYRAWGDAEAQFSVIVIVILENITISVAIS